MKKRAAIINKKKLSGLALEAFSIIFAVFFALAVDDWREDMEKQELADEMTSRLIEEVKNNKDVIVETQKENIEMIKGLKQSLLVKEKQIKDSLGELKAWGFDATKMKSTAWESSKLTSALNYMNLDLVNDLSRLYSLQQTYNEFLASLLSEFALMSAKLNSDKEPELQVRSLYHHLAVMVSLGGELEKSYEEFVDKYSTLNQ